MKSPKGLLLILGFVLLGMTDIEVNSDTDSIKDNIFYAIRSVDYTSINVLLSDGTNVDTVDQEGNTPLIAATQMGNPRIIDIVLFHNPNINKQNKQGDTPLTIAAKTGQLDVVKKLISLGADKTIRNANGDSPLTLASKYGYDEITEYLKKM